MLAAGFTGFMVKYTEEVYQVSPSKSSVLTGGVIVPSAIIGAIVGGIIVKKYDLEVKGIVRLIMIGSTVVLIGVGCLIFIKCEGKPSIGIEIPGEM